MVDLVKDTELPALGAITGAEIVTAVQGGANKKGAHADVISSINAATNLASAATTSLATSTSIYVNITGTTTITAFGTGNAGLTRWLRFAGALTLTHNATSLILPGGANIVTAAGDIALFVCEGSGNWRCLAYQQQAVEPAGGAWVPYTPATVTATTPAGSGFAYTLNHCRYKKVGRTVHIAIDITITNAGSGPAASGALLIDLPFPVAFWAAGCGLNNGDGNMLRCSAAAAAALTVRLYNNLTAIATGARMILSLHYEATS